MARRPECHTQGQAKSWGCNSGPTPKDALKSDKETPGREVKSWHRGAPEELGKVVGAGWGGGKGAGGPGLADGGLEWPGDPGASSPPRPAALTRGPGGVARRCGSSRPAAAAAATAAAEAGTHHAAALMAGPEGAPRLGSVLPGRSEGGGLRADTRDRAQPGELGGTTPGSEPRVVSGAAFAQFRSRRSRQRRRVREVVCWDSAAGIPLGQRVLKTDNSQRKTPLSRKVPSLK